MRLSGRTLLVVGGLVALLAVTTSDQIVPPTTAYQAQMRIWLVARATGITAYLILCVVVTLGLILSHPVNQSTWRLSKRLFPWHENLFVFVVAFVAVHVASLVLDPYAGVGLAGALLPGVSSYRSVPVALGTLALYAVLLTALTARYTRLLPAGAWLRIHRFSLVVFALAWTHGVLAGTDTEAFRLLYASTGGLVIAAAAYRYWVGRQRRPSFATSLSEPTSGAGEPRRRSPAERVTPPQRTRHVAQPSGVEPTSVAEPPAVPAARISAAPGPPSITGPGLVASRAGALPSGLAPLPGILAVLRRARRIEPGIWSTTALVGPPARPPTGPRRDGR